MPIKLFECILWGILAVKILRLKNYRVNQLLSLGFLSFAIYFLLESFSFTFAATSPENFVIMRSVWKIELFFSTFSAFFMFLAVFIIRKGEKSLTLINVGILIVLFLVAAIMLMIFFPMEVVDAENRIIDPATFPPKGVFYAKYKITTIGAIISAIPLLFYFIGCFYLFPLYRVTADRDIRQKMLLMILGLLFVPFGYLYYILLGLVNAHPDFGISMIGHIFWISAPLLIYFSQRKNRE